MDLLLRHYQNKKFKTSNTTSICELKLYEYDNLIHFISDFTFDYLKYGNKTQLCLHHGFTVNLKTGDIQTYYQLSNYSITELSSARSKNIRKKNDFDSIYNLIENGIYRGEKRRGYWGVRYNKSIDKIINILIGKIKPLMDSEHLQMKEYMFKHNVNPIFDLFVDFHLHKKKIKGHDSVYHTIQNEYPKSKWLKLNENKFLPAVLDSYGIKSKYLIGEINKRPDIDLNISTLSYVCGLFGESYVDYFKKIEWVDLISQGSIHQKRKHELKNEYEKNCMVQLINDWSKNQTIFNDNLIEEIFKLLNLRVMLESKGLVLKFNSTTCSDFERLLNKWENYKNHFRKGYKVRYSFPAEFITELESDIIVGEKTFNVKVLKTEEDFFTEGYLMKNCMSKQFNKGVVFIYISMKCGKVKINLEYKNGKLISSFGKANTPVDKIFSEAVSKLSNKMLKYSDIKWIKEKYDYIKK